MDFVLDFLSDHIVEALIAVLSYVAGQGGFLGKAADKVSKALQCKE